MALQTIPGGLWLNPPWGGLALPPTFGTSAINSTTARNGKVFVVGTTGNIHKVGFKVLGAITPNQCEVRVETVGADGLPTGTLVATNTKASFTPAASTWFLLTLTADAAVTRGQLVAIVIQPTGTAPDITINDINGSYGGSFPYSGRYSGTVWSMSSDMPMVATEYSDGSYPHHANCWPVQTVQNLTFNSTTTPDEKGIKFRTPFPGVLEGFWMFVDGDGDFSVKLYEDTTLVETVVWDKDYRNNLTSAAAPYWMTFAANHNTTTNTWYRLTVVPAGATNVSLVEFTVNTSAIMAAMPGGGNLIATSRTDAGAFTDTDTTFPMIGPRYAGFDDGVQTAVPHNYAWVG